ncbi:hypothetical protein [Peredibacter starrii]|uniref:Uncharacterized protein n=1 Tax=Peredibacter starrii TaxID=28202 RepID=A0AAX4HQZ5_9BACT|nr:hypothetical protein [Peredibacter starrii]WPU65764.1 hypothetical protein SOO65_03295 [Peredibacter starrii]
MERKENPFIFYLTLEENLPKTFYVFDRTLKDLGFILVPVRIDQLQTLVAATDQTQIIVIASVIDSREMKMYNEKVRGLLKYVLKSKRLTFMHLSSYTKLNDIRQYALGKNYFFMKYPLDARLLSAKIARYYDLKSEQSSRWPGGKRAGLGSVV